MKLHTPIIKLPTGAELAIALIKEDLKSEKFFNHLDEIGLSDADYQTHLSVIILNCLGFRTIPDELFDRYKDLLLAYSKKVGSNGATLEGLALELFIDLKLEKRKANAQSGPILTDDKD